MVSPDVDWSNAVTLAREVDVDDNETSRIETRTFVRSPGRATGFATTTSTGDGDSLAASAIVVRQNRSNDDTAGSRYCHESSAPLMMSRPDPTERLQIAARPFSESTRAPAVSATADAPAGSRRGNASSVMRRLAVSPLATTDTGRDPLSALHESTPVRRSKGPLTR